MAPRSAAAKLAKRNKNKKTAAPPKRSDAPQQQEAAEVSAKIPLELQQLLLNVFRNAFPSRFGSDLKSLLQEVKQHLYHRDFLTAFGKAEYLEAYAVRWSPSRALGYLQIFNDLEQHFLAIEEAGSRETGKPWKVVCLGGGAGAEIVGLAGLLKQLVKKDVPSESIQDERPSEESSDTAMSAPALPQFEISAIDIANWTPVVTSLHSAITTAPTLSQYASAAAKASNVELLPPHLFKTTSVQQDILTMSTDDLSDQLHNADLITLMFTLNELYSTSLAKTQAFLMRLTASLQQGSLLLVVDSPGSYSTVTLNGAEKQYPMHWLLDHTLLSVPKDAKSTGEGPKWGKIHSDESRWFRLPEGLKYPIDLENMRYQIHLYERLP
ncbi:uncharacterized protein BKCO1_7300031 [Diplodia corticola]|uniref:25S rRNA (Uridine(2843)-N(3))-methyltransferase n=1 Tax=Diplodia corticola TaxID=236234 RepID=A0A1J9QNT3_9PEZI|nr:uncharacterized protein BKCO1_7300031 [Diplodia corticola]OJD29714.1 hypothetical protein BKCO1_7300031 [Diplodia corticola]